MDFSLSDEQRALADLAAQSFKDLSPLERLKAVEQSDAGWDRDLWGELAKAGLLAAALPEEDGGGGGGFLDLWLLLPRAARLAAMALPEEYGGSGGGFLDLCLLLEQHGRRAAMVPLLPTLAGAALPLV